ncbi:NUDIX domain-containing protein [Streptomyces sp. TR02-1]|uniref:NUDIX domain-containing protein n=1 Tax=Streptomyces sp. TR02-1 TaxID=3385977 RepID=UPI0039A2E599
MPEHHTDDHEYRIAALAMIRRPDQSILLAQAPDNADGWDLVAGHAQRGEDPAGACASAVQQTTGLSVAPSRVLAAQYLPARALDTTAALYLVFDCGVAEEKVQQPTPEEERTFRWAGPHDLDGLAERVRQRIVHAVRSLAAGAPYLSPHRRPTMMAGPQPVGTASCSVKQVTAT